MDVTFVIYLYYDIDLNNITPGSLDQRVMNIKKYLKNAKRMPLVYKHNRMITIKLNCVIFPRICSIAIK